VCQVRTRQKLLYKALAELIIHKAVCSNLTIEACIDTQSEYLLHEGSTQRILTIAGLETSTVSRAELSVPGRYVGWVPHDGVIDAGTEHSFQGWQIFALIRMLTFRILTCQFPIEDLLPTSQRCMQ